MITSHLPAHAAGVAPQAPGGDAAELQARADEVAELLRTLSNPNRLRVMCLLAEGERSVGEIAGALGLSQPVASQHLARMRSEGLVCCRREGRKVHYGIADPRVHLVMSALHRAFCPRDSR